MQAGLDQLQDCRLPESCRDDAAPPALRDPLPKHLRGLGRALCMQFRRNCYWQLEISGRGKRQGWVGVA